MRNLYKAKIPKRSHHQTVLDVLRMSEEQFTQFQNTARQFSNEDFVFDHRIKQPSAKVKNSSYQVLTEVGSGSELAVLLNQEQYAHNDPHSEVHKGGGIYEAASSVFNGLWNTIGLGPEFSSWFGHFDYDSPENTMSKDDVLEARIVQQSYKEPAERVSEIGDWERITNLDTERFSSWLDLDDKEIHVALRGTKANFSDIWSDTQLIFTNKTSAAQNEVKNYLEAVANAFPDFKLTASGHSLGANQLVDVLSGSDLNYEKVYLFNPGTSPLTSLTGQRGAVEDEKFHLFLNSGDILSNTFASLIPSERDNVTWSQSTHNPLSNHGLAQWTSDT